MVIEVKAVVSMKSFNSSIKIDLFFRKPCLKPFSIRVNGRRNRKLSDKSVVWKKNFANLKTALTTERKVE